LNIHENNIVPLLLECFQGFLAIFRHSYTVIEPS
jgi:hypothetical protein